MPPRAQPARPTGRGQVCDAAARLRVPALGQDIVSAGISAYLTHPTRPEQELVQLDRPSIHGWTV